jgi:hypothetical protein
MIPTVNCYGEKHAKLGLFPKMACFRITFYGCILSLR